MALNLAYLQSNVTIKGDECYTPYYAVDPLLEFLTDKNKIIWCPFDEEWSAFYQTFKQNGFKVIRSHINEGKNFLLMSLKIGIFLYLIRPLVKKMKF